MIQRATFLPAYQTVIFNTGKAPPAVSSVCLLLLLDCPRAASVLPSEEPRRAVLSGHLEEQNHGSNRGSEAHSEKRPNVAEMG